MYSLQCKTIWFDLAAEGECRAVKSALIIAGENALVSLLYRFEGIADCARFCHHEGMRYIHEHAQVAGFFDELEQVWRELSADLRAFIRARAIDAPFLLALVI